MSLIMKLPQIIEDSKKEFEEILSIDSTSSYLPLEIVEKQDPADNMLVEGENTSFMKYLIEQKAYREKIDLIYIDPPFFSKADYNMKIELKLNDDDKKIVMSQKTFKDTWENGMQDYLKMLTVRLYLMKELLSEKGTIWVHLDGHAVHYVKVIMDEVFGEKNFINEIIWHYKSGGASKRCFAKKHDNLLFYARSRKYYFLPQKEKSYNRGFKPYRFKGVKEYQDEMGWYTMVNRKDVWQLNMVGRTSAERTGYATQKPESLIERILESCTKEGDLCADFFCGSGTLAAVSNTMNRKWICCDKSNLAIINSHRRLNNANAQYTNYKEYKNEDDEKGGEIEVDVSLRPSEDSEKMLLRIELLRYEMSADKKRSLQAKFMTELEEIIKEDSLHLIAYWSVDTDCRGWPIRPDAYFYKEEKKIETVYESSVTDFGPIGIRAVDIFGNSTRLIVEL